MLGEENPSVLFITYNNLAGCYSTQGRYAEAQALYLKALELSKRLLGEKDPKIAAIRKNLARLYRNHLHPRREFVVIRRICDIQAT
jgi:tetratricopeptide (TPR) repeat protein